MVVATRESGACIRLTMPTRVDEIERSEGEYKSQILGVSRSNRHGEGEFEEEGLVVEGCRAV